MEKVIIYNLDEDLIENLTLLLEKFSTNNDFSKIACVFGGKRPALFLYNSIAKRVKKSFIPPRIFSMDEFIDYLFNKKRTFYEVSNLEMSFIVYKLIKKYVPTLLNSKSFSEFLPWAEEIISFTEQLDLEDIRSDSLFYVEKSAEIGYDVPENINQLLRHIITIRDVYHKELMIKNIYSRGMRYLEVSNDITVISIDEFDYVVFCNLFYLHNTEIKIIKSILDRDKGICILQGSPFKWSSLLELIKKLNINITNFDLKLQEHLNFNFSLYQGFDTHSQVCILREILSKIEDKNNTVIVLPKPQSVIPLLIEISSVVEEFNISVGYPLKYSSLYSLFLNLCRAQESRKNSKYYMKDYLALLLHPLVKNLKIKSDSSATKVLVHKIQDFLQGSEESPIGGSIFLRLKDIEEQDGIYRTSSSILNNMDIKINFSECKDILLQLHKVFFKIWENINNFEQFANSFKTLLDVLVNKSIVCEFSFNLKVLEKLYVIADEFLNLSFRKERFSTDEIWEIFKRKLESEMISFLGSPLKGIQILGLFETRAISFKNVIIIDANESVLPTLKIYEPLIPQQVMLSFGLNRIEKEEEIQRYCFIRLLSAAKEVHIIYEENWQKERSRFIEELLWKRQIENKSIESVEANKVSFNIKIPFKNLIAKKTSEMIEFLKNEKYSASRINTYLNCPLQFYYRYVLGLEQKEDLLEEPQVKHIGVFLHELLEETFSKFKNKQPLIDSNFKKYFFKKAKEKFKKELQPRMRSDSFLLEHIIMTRLKQFLESESKRKVVEIISLEEELTNTITFSNKNIEFVYTIDRIDRLEDKSIIIIDYKTGGGDLIPKRLRSLEGLEFNRISIKENIRSFQLPIYYYFISDRFPNSDINAQLYNLRTLEQSLFISKEDYPYREKILKICLDSLLFILDEIFNPDIGFEPDREERRCLYCEFNLSCY